MIRPLVGLALALSVPLIQGRVDAQRGRFRSQEEILYVWSGQHLRTLSPGLENVLADVYWLRTVQYFGGQRAFATDKRFDLVLPLVEITTTLDPRFELAYRYGAIFLAEQHPNGAGRPKDAVALLERGVKANPSSWRLRQDQGFFHFFFLHDAVTAARILDEAAAIPGAPDWLHSSAADFLERGGERETSRRVWKRLHQDSYAGMRDVALFNLNRLDALDAVDAHQAAVEEFRRRTGRWPATLSDLQTAGLLRAPLVDAGRVPFAYDRETGRVSIARSSYLWRPGR